MSQKIYIEGNYLLIDVTTNGNTITYEYPQGQSVYYSRFKNNAIDVLEIVNTIHNGKSFVKISDITANNVIDGDNNPYNLTDLLEVLRFYTGTFVGTNIKQTT